VGEVSQGNGDQVGVTKRWGLSEAPFVEKTLPYFLDPAMHMQQATENIIQTGEPSRSALKVAAMRAAHQLLDEPNVLDDPIALPILGPKTEASLRDNPFTLNDPISRFVRAGLVIRSKLAEDELSHSVVSGIKQYVVLGAGLDTFAYRNPYTDIGLRVFEVDHLSTQVWKRKALEEASIKVPDSMTFVPVDFERSTLAEGLRQSGFQMDQPAFFSWLGVTLYLTKEAVFDTLRFVASLPKGSTIVFDYLIPVSMLNPLERVIREFVREQIVGSGEPWKSNFDPAELREKVLGLGFASVETFGADELNLRYLARRKDGLQTSPSFRVASAKV
jgi:methyltransferase (TIGR00027 family)